jgi:hypothetical protein
MPRAVEVHLADKTFASNAAAKDFFKRILASKKPITESDYPAVLALFKQYLPSYDIVNVKTALNTQDGAPHWAFLVTYMRNGEEVYEFKSYKKAFDGINRKNEINKQLRLAVSSHTMDFKKKHYRKKDTNICRCCRKLLNDKEVQVDHYPVPFCDIVHDFMASRNISFDNITPDKNGKNIPPEILQDFAHYHNGIAKYRLVCQECNVKSFRNPDYKKNKEETYIDSDGEEII